MDRQVELDLIDAHIAVRGVTPCPDRYVGAVDLALPEAEAKRRLAAMPPSRKMTHAEFALTVYALLFPRPKWKYLRLLGENSGGEGGAPKFRGGPRHSSELPAVEQRLGQRLDLLTDRWPWWRKWFR